MAVEYGSAANLTISLPAGGDLRTKQYTFVKLSGATVVAVAAETDVPIGVLQNAPNTGETASVIVSGGTKLVSGANIGAGVRVRSSAAGKAIATTGSQAARFIVGRFIDAPGADNVVGSAVINCISPVGDA